MEITANETQVPLNNGAVIHICGIKNIVIIGMVRKEKLKIRMVSQPSTVLKNLGINFQATGSHRYSFASVTGTGSVDMFGSILITISANVDFVTLFWISVSF